MAKNNPEQADIVVVGAGPAGIAAVIHAAEAGVKVVLLDENPEAGGAIWRGLAGSKRSMMKGYEAGRKALQGLSASRVVHIRQATVWEITRDRVVSFSVEGKAHQISARRIILATGAVERPMPFAGWTLPGVLTAGAAQIMLKTSGLIPPGPIVMAGSGPLLYLVASQLLEAGCAPTAIVETTPPQNKRQAMRRLPASLAAWTSIAQGFSMQRRLRRAGVKLFRDASGLKASGNDGVREIRFRCGGRSIALPCASLLIHAGVVPNVQLSRAIGLEHVWSENEKAWHPDTDDMGRTNVEGIHIAGDGAGIAGAEVATHSGRLAAIAALEGMVPAVDSDIDRNKRAMRRHRAIRPFLNALFAPRSEFLCPEDETIICRCESVTAGQVRNLAQQGSYDPNAIKSLCRAGMGPCQGRYCGLTVSQLVAEARGVSPAETGYFRLRSPVKPVTLGELAGLDIPVDDNG